MADGTGIEWTDATWNPTVGCTKVSPGCDHCYAETFVSRFAGSKGFPLPFEEMLLRGERFLNLPRTWKEPRRVFVNSLSDLFHADVPDEFIRQVFDVMAETPRHTFQLLTKRHARLRAWATKHQPEPLPNVWLGVSVEDQRWADIRIPALLDTPAAVRWISAEPLLGPVDISDVLARGKHQGEGFDHRTSLDWIVVGGESGAGARPMDAAWARALRDDCARYGVPFLFKQWGSHDANGEPMPKKQAGRVLDGALYDGYPESAPAPTFAAATARKGSS
jgi:protein gp37